MNKSTLPDRQQKEASSPATPASQWLSGFGEYLLNVQGLTPGTRRDYCVVVSRFLDGFCGRAAPDWPSLRGEHLTRFVCREASRLKRHARGTPAVAIRALLRYLKLIGAVRAGLEAAVPRTPRWKHGELPPSLSAEEVEHVLSCVTTDTRAGLRNRAILMLLARMGLRAVEVCQLTLDDIDWRSGSLLIRKTKSRRDRRLPLPNDVGAALCEYLQCGRRRDSSRRVFLRVLSPISPFRNSAAVCRIARRALTRAGIVKTPAAAHLFRHASATLMLTSGASFNEIADVMGHVSLKTTAIYAKLDLAALSAVSLPWPGSRP